MLFDILKIDRLYGFRFAQGWLYSKAVKASDISAFFSRQIPPARSEELLA